MKRKLLIIGGSYMNLQMKINPKNKNGDTTPGSDYSYHPFGDSAITAISTAKLGGECVFATRFGNDTNGKRLYEYYKSCGISNQLMKKDENAQTGMSITVYSDLHTHDNFVAHGASLRFTKEEIDDAFITMPDLFLVPLEEIGCEERTVVVSADDSKTDQDESSFVKTLAATAEYPSAKASAPLESENKQQRDALEDEEISEPAGNSPVISSETVTSYRERESLALYALQKAEDRKVDILLQYTPFTAQYPLESMKNIKILVVSDEMLYNLTGFFPNNTDKALRSLVALSQKVQSRYYIVQQGDHSAFIYDGNHYETVSAPSSLVGLSARDEEAKMQQTFMGALATEYLESKNIVHATKFAIIVSLLTRAKFGNLEKVLSRAELEQYAADHGIDLFR